MAKVSKALFEYDEAGNITAKTCSKCGTMIPMAAFAKDKRRAGGVESSCKACKSIKDRKYKAAEKRKAADTVDRRSVPQWEIVELAGRRKFGVMLQELFPTQEIIIDYNYAEKYTVNFYLDFANTGINYVYPAIENTQRITEVRVELASRNEDAETMGVTEEHMNEMWNLVEVKPGREVDALRKIILLVG